MTSARAIAAITRLRFGIELLGDHTKVAFNWRFRGAEIAIRADRPAAARAARPRRSTPGSPATASPRSARSRSASTPCAGATRPALAKSGRRVHRAVQQLAAPPAGDGPAQRCGLWPGQSSPTSPTSPRRSTRRGAGLSVRGRELVARLALGTGPAQLPAAAVASGSSRSFSELSDPALASDVGSGDHAMPTTAEIIEHFAEQAPTTAVCVRLAVHGAARRRARSRHRRRRPHRGSGRRLAALADAAMRSAVRMAGALHAAALSGRESGARRRVSRRAPRMGHDAGVAAARNFLAREQAGWPASSRRRPQTNETRRHHRAARRLPGPRRAPRSRYGAARAGRERRHEPALGPASPTAPRAGAGAAATWLITTDWTGEPPPLDAAPTDPLARRLRSQSDRHPRSYPSGFACAPTYGADQAERLARFDAATAVAIAHDARVERAVPTPRWLEQRLTCKAAPPTR